MRITKNLLLFITIMFMGIFSSKEAYSKEKNSKSDYSYVTEKVSIYSDIPIGSLELSDAYFASILSFVLQINKPIVGLSFSSFSIWFTDVI